MIALTVTMWAGVPRTVFSIVIRTMFVWCAVRIVGNGIRITVVVATIVRIVVIPMRMIIAVMVRGGAKMAKGLELRTCYCPLCDKHFEVRSNESHGYCPDCGHHVVLRVEEVTDGT
jgi:predicted RNA-binding Zn-ribbon protein involved in translation (DUF1610 family)